MNRNYSEKAPREDVNACGRGPVVARSPSYQQPVAEAVAQTKKAIEVCNSLPSLRGKRY